jgi:hypothetical protein
VTVEKFMQYASVYLGILAGDRYDTTIANMPGPSWDDAEHPMHASTGEKPDADAS